MTITLTSDAAASTPSHTLTPAADHNTSATKSASSTKDSLPPLPPQDFSENNIRHMLFGTPEAVQQTIHNLHSRGYAEPNDWSPAISTGRPAR